MSGFRRPSSHQVPERVLRRIWQSINVGSTDECWPWTLSTNSCGYGQVGWSVGRRAVMKGAHRVAWEATNGPIPEGLTIDHLCRNTICCNPSHLRLLTNRENAGDTAKTRRTHCPAGHAYDDENTYVDPKGHRRCRICNRERQRRVAA